jgi:hypothetical protein
MCMFCAAIPITATAGTVLDSKDRQKRKNLGLPSKRIRPMLVLTLIALTLLMAGSIVFHIFLGKYLPPV